MEFVIFKSYTFGIFNTQCMCCGVTCFGYAGFCVHTSRLVWF